MDNINFMENLYYKNKYGCQCIIGASFIFITDRYHLLDVEIPFFSDLVPSASEFHTISDPLYPGFRSTEHSAGQVNLRSIHNLQIRRGHAQAGGKSKNVNVDVLVDVTVIMGSVTAVVASVFLGKIVDGDRVTISHPSGVVGGLFDGHAVINPLYPGSGDARGVAVKHCGLPLSFVLVFGFDGEVRNSCATTISN